MAANYEAESMSAVLTDTSPEFSGSFGENFK
jgi:hypothetical protein